MRKWIVERAKKVDIIDGNDIEMQVEKISKLGEKLRKRERHLKERRDPISPKDYLIQRSPHLFHKGSKRRRLTVSEKVSVAYKAIVELQKYGDIAKEYRVSYMLVNQIVKKA